MFLKKSSKHVQFGSVYEVKKTFSWRFLKRKEAGTSYISRCAPFENF